jgi:hypothetical protein
MSLMVVSQVLAMFVAGPVGKAKSWNPHSFRQRFRDVDQVILRVGRPLAPQAARRRLQVQPDWAR